MPDTPPKQAEGNECQPGRVDIDAPGRRRRVVFRPVCWYRQDGGGAPRSLNGELHQALFRRPEERARHPRSPSSIVDHCASSARDLVQRTRRRMTSWWRGRRSGQPPVRARLQQLVLGLRGIGLRASPFDYQRAGLYRLSGPQAASAGSRFDVDRAGPRNCRRLLSLCHRRPCICLFVHRNPSGSA